MSSPDSLGIGYVNRATGNEMALDGAIDYVNVYGSVLSESEIALEHETTAWEPDQAPDMSNAYKSDPIDLYYTGYQNVTAYRIPSRRAPVRSWPSSMSETAVRAMPATSMPSCDARARTAIRSLRRSR